jgi:hypothetical protein
MLSEYPPFVQRECDVSKERLWRQEKTLPNRGPGRKSQETIPTYYEQGPKWEIPKKDGNASGRQP